MNLLQKEAPRLPCTYDQRPGSPVDPGLHVVFAVHPLDKTAGANHGKEKEPVEDENRTGNWRKMPHVENGEYGEERGNGDPLEDGNGITKRGVAPKAAVETERGEGQRLKQGDYRQTIPKQRLILSGDTKIETEQEG